MSKWPQHKAPAFARRALPLIEEALKYSWESLVDFGCGYGLHCAEFAKSGRRIVGVDLGFLPEALEEAKQGGYELLSSSWEELPDASFDVGYSHHCLEHARDPIGWLHEWGRIIKPDGKLFVAVPAHGGRVAPGHIAVGWNVGQLIYMLALAGWDCSAGRFCRCQDDIWGIANRPKKMVLGNTAWGNFGGNRKRLPESLRVTGGFPGEMESLNW